MYSEVLTVFFGNKNVTAIRTAQRKWPVINVAFIKMFVTDLTKILPLGTVVVVQVFVRSTAARTHDGFRNGTFRSAFNRFDGFAIFMFVISKEKQVIYFFGYKNFR